MFPQLRLLLRLCFEVMDPGLTHSRKSLNKTVGIHLNITRFFLDMLSRVPFKSGPMSFGTQRAETLDI